MYYDVQKSAERIRKLRESKDLTQNEAAEKMGFSFGGYRKLECGLNGGSIDSLMLVAEFYHVLQVRELLDDCEDMEGGVTRTSAGHIVVRILGRNAQKLTEVTERILTW